MNSPLPKCLHPVAGRPILYRIVQALQGAGIRHIRVVVGHGESLVRQVVEPLGCICMKQELPRGTADAVIAADPSTMDGGVIVLNGDHPLIDSKDIFHILEKFQAQKTALSVATCELKKPGAFGRIVRHHREFHSIVEVKDASVETKKIKEVNTGIYVTQAKILSEYLPQISPQQSSTQKVSLQNAQGELYLTHVVSLMKEAGLLLGTIAVSPRVACGVNTQRELAKATKSLFQRILQKHLLHGVVIVDPKATYIEEGVEIGAGTVIYPGVYIKGPTRIGKYCVLEPHGFVINSHIGDNVQIKAGCYFESVQVKSRSVIGPYARLRPETKIGHGAKIGNFVEMKNVEFGRGAQASHLTYLGDATVGEGTNIGCGTITCNYATDKKKYRTIIGKNVFVGSDTQFVAPVTVGDNAYVGSGSTITKDIPEGALGLSRSQQTIKKDYKPPCPPAPSKPLASDKLRAPNKVE